MFAESPHSRSLGILIVGGANLLFFNYFIVVSMFLLVLFVLLLPVLDHFPKCVIGLHFSWIMHCLDILSFLVSSFQVWIISLDPLSQRVQ